MALGTYIEIKGNTGKPSDARFTPKGTPVTTFSVATYAGGKGEDKKTIWWDCEAWDEIAEMASEALNQKGMYVFVAGHVKLETWNDKNTGDLKSKMKIIVDRFSILPKEDRNAPAQQAQEPVLEDDDEEIIPSA